MNKKTLFFFSFSALFLFLGLFSSCQQDNKLKVMTFNIRYDNPGDGINAWPNRVALVESMLNEKSPDILGTQEVLKHQFDALGKMFPNYTPIGIGRDDGKEAGEYNALFIKNARFEILKSATFSLSETPNIVGVKGWDAVCCRIATWALLKDKKTGKQLLALNTHLDHMGQTARRESILLIKNRIQNILKDNDAVGCPVAITGDFNCTPSDEPYLLMTEDNVLTSSSQLAEVTKGPRWTFHAFGAVPEAKRTQIDYIFLTKNITVESYETIGEKPNAQGIFITDHLPVMVVLNMD